MIEERNIYKELVYSSFWFHANANDFFNYACADAVQISVDDLEWVLPIMEKYPAAGLNACMSFIRKQKPIEPWITKEFKAAYAELETLNPTIDSEV